MNIFINFSFILDLLGFKDVNKNLLLEDRVYDKQ
jgi:hypothetical protein